MIYFFSTVNTVQLLSMIFAMLKTLLAANGNSLITALETKEIVILHTFSILTHNYQILSCIMGALKPPSVSSYYLYSHEDRTAIHTTSSERTSANKLEQVLQTQESLPDPIATVQ
jgi:hypothetical protein